MVERQSINVHLLEVRTAAVLITGEGLPLLGPPPSPLTYNTRVQASVGPNAALRQTAWLSNTVFSQPTGSSQVIFLMHVLKLTQWRSLRNA